MSISGSQAEILAGDSIASRRLSSTYVGSAAVIQEHMLSRKTNVGESVIFMTKVRADDMHAQSFAGLKHHQIDFQHSSASGYALIDRVLYCPTAMDKFG